MYINNRIYGFSHYDDILFKIANRQLLYYGEEASGHSVFFKPVSLNKVQARLPISLLMNFTQDLIDKDNIVKCILDEFNL